RLRFLPLTDFVGDVTITYHAWDRTRGSAGSRANLALPGVLGGETAFSAAAETAKLTVLPVNDRPVLNTAPLTFLPSILPGDADPAGTTVGQLLGSSVTDVDAGAAQGIAVTLAVSSPKTGKWQFNHGGLWSDVGKIPRNQALLLEPADGIRFVPAAGF